MSTLLPFLYHTRTIQFTVRRAARPALRSFHATSIRPRRDEPNIPFEWDDNSPHRGEGEVGEGEPVGKSGNSTITPTEDRAFRKIFADIAKRSRHEKDQHGFPVSRAPAFTKESTSAVDEVLKKYPPALRESMRAALGLPEPAPSAEDIEAQEAEEAEEALAIEVNEQWERQKALRDEAAERIEQLLKDCKTDDEVGAVLEREVFSMVKKLGIDEGKTGTRFALGETLQTMHNEAVEDEAAEAKLDMDSHGPLYSLHILQGLRALDQDFARPSSLALKVLPRIRELGMASYVLGASTPFYNELVAITWRRHGDVRGVMSLLQEMLFAGLTPDKQTLALVHEIEDRLDAMSDGKEGPFAKLLSTMPEHDFEMRSQLGTLANRLEPAVRRH
ncbi:hypothetical protein F5X68DRAFT_264032 [Plectosphaerella plurivora]|uniref:Mtf2-like C-terminal domain-containing protein n=1 Tax=Plectosphaerella plurivora TaxID=936078 RepID=A0A9P8V5U5_9PEZI|nr:hypothetical protein F5X68DRAFT_264032 [Plectosphaerella plurivora]